MATIDVAVSSDLTPEQAWKLASDLRRFDEWLTIFGGWRSEVPSEIETGTCVSSCIKVKGFRNIIHWQVTGYDEPKVLELVGRGRGGIRIGLSVRVEGPGPESEVASGSVFRVRADVSGGLFNTPVGNLVVRVLKSDVRKSVTKLAALR